MHQRRWAVLVIQPEVVRFETEVWEDVSSVSIERSAARLVEAWGERGPHAELVDVAEIRTTVKLTRRLARGEVSRLGLGRQGVLTVHVGPGGTDAGREKVEVRCVLTGIATSAGAGGGGTGAGVQVLTFVANGVGVDGAGNGSVDPVTIRKVDLADFDALV
jgi:hypothetical protein